MNYYDLGFDLNFFFLTKPPNSYCFYDVSVFLVGE